jgi:hypothetical protein
VSAGRNPTRKVIREKEMPVTGEAFAEHLYVSVRLAYTAVLTHDCQECVFEQVLGEDKDHHQDRYDAARSNLSGI